MIPEGTEISCSSCATIIAYVLEDLAANQDFQSIKLEGVSFEDAEVYKNFPRCPKCKTLWARLNGRVAVHSTVGWV